jgi:DNA gyrase inhibitor GyrI
MVVLMAGCSVFGGKAAEEPPYEVLVNEGDFEIRRYAPMVVARTRVAGADRDEAVGTGFMRLFDYITGENAPGDEIAMTAPVLSEPEAGEGEDIAMTAPVLQEKRAEGWEVAFVLPEDMTLDGAPRPTNSEVTLAEVPSRRVGVVRFSGFLTAEKIAEHRAALSDWLEARGESPDGRYQAAGYNPPWTIPWLRRNEVMVPLE